jgi:periplasmic protein TonB
MHNNIEPAAGLAKLAAMVLLAHLAVIAAFLFYFPDKPIKPNPETVITLSLKPLVGQIESRPSSPASRPPQPRPLPPPEPKIVQPAEAPVRPAQINAETSSLPSAPVEPAVGPVGAPTTGKENAKDSGGALNAQENTGADFKAAYLNNPKPPYPRLAVRQKIEGTVTLIVRVLPDGRAGEVRIDQSSGNDLLDNAALTTVKSWRFVPARQAGVAVAADVRVPIVFSLK